MGKFADTSIYGSLDVEGVLNVADKLEGNTGKFSGNVTAPNFIGTASKVANSFKIQLNSGGSEGTNQFTFDGENTKTVNITPGAIGAPTLAGTGASGTWAIAISGNAASATKLQGKVKINNVDFDGSAAIETHQTYHKQIANNTNLNTITTGGWYVINGAANASTLTNTPTKTTFSMLVAPNSSSRLTQVIYDFDGNSWIRYFQGGTTWTAWNCMLHSSNYNSYAPTKTGTGASGTWAIAITGNAASATKLATSRTLTIGNTGKSFNGTGDVSWSLAEIGASESGHSHANTKGNPYAYGLTIEPNKLHTLLDYTGAPITATMYGELLVRVGITNTGTLQGFACVLRNSTGSKWEMNILYQSGSSSNHPVIVIDGNVPKIKHFHSSTYPAYVMVEGITDTSSGIFSFSHIEKLNHISSLGNVPSATKLATPRAINGTNFDGSAAITTANWGTARTLTVGGTGKSVNGAGNVTWTLAEIGAAPSSHTHNQIAGVNYVSGGSEKPSFFGAGKMRYQMLGAGVAASGGAKGGIPNVSWSDALWISAYGSDVPTANVLLFSKGGARMGFRQQSYNSETWGAFNELLHSNNYNDYAPTKTGTGASGTWSIAITGNSASATKLATKRTINGTDFDGSAAITTTIWGASRNLTIGNKTQAVNGAGNVTWSLADIGVEENHTWTGKVKQGTWSPICLFGHTALGGKAILTIGHTRGNVVVNAMFLVAWGHSGHGSITQLESHGYTQVKVRLMGTTENDVVFEILDEATGTAGAENGYVCKVNTLFGTISKYTTYRASTGTQRGETVATKFKTIIINSNEVYKDNYHPLSDKLTTARTLTIGATGKSFDGSANVSWALSEIGAAPSVSGGYLPLSGGTMTGNILMPNKTINFKSNSTGNTPQLTGFRGATDLNTRLFGDEGGFSYTTYDGSSPNRPATSNNANGLFTFNTHSGSAYTHQLAFNYDCGIYHRRSTEAWSRICKFGDNIGTGATNYAAGNHTHGYLPLGGGKLTGVLESTSSDPALRVLSGTTSKAAYGWLSTHGAYIYNYNSGRYLGIKDDGTPHYQGNTIWHAGNSNKDTESWKCKNIEISTYFKTLPITLIEASATQYVLLCPNAANNDILGSIYMTRTSGHYRQVKIDIQITSTTSGVVAGFINTSQTMEADSDTYQLVTLTYSGVSYFAIKIVTNGYPHTYSYYSGFIKASNESNMLKTINTGVTNEALYTNDKGKVIINASNYIFKAVPKVGSNSLYYSGNNNIGTGATNYAAGNQPITAISTTASAATFTRGAGNLTLTYPTFNQSTTGSAASLTTSRTIWGQSFNGTGNVSGALTGVSTITASGTIKSTASQGLNIEVGSGWAYHQLKSGSSIAHLAFNNTAVDGHLANTYHIRPNGSTSVLGINTTHVKALALIVANEGLQINSSNGGSWITGKTSTKGITFPTQTTGSFHTALRINSSSGHVLTYGGLGNSIGFYGYAASQTENSYNYHFVCDTATGNWSTGQSITANKFIKIGSSNAYVLAGDGGHIEHTAANKASTVVDRDSSGDINCRLVRTSYDNQTTISGGIVYRVSTTDNYHRVCSSPAAIRTWLGVQDSNHTHSYLPLAGGNVTGRLVIGTNVANSHGLLTINPTKGNATTGINIWNGSDTTSRIWLSAENALCITRGDNSLTGIAVFATGHVSIGKTTNTERLEVGGNIKGEVGYFDIIRGGGKTYYNVATRVTTTGTETGIFKITLPFGWTGNMGTYEIDIYEYNGRSHSKIIVSGYNYSTGSWVNTRTKIIGELVAPVRLGYDGSKCCILIGETNTAWSYPQVYVSKFTAGFVHTTDNPKNWTISLLTSETGLSAIMTPPLSKMLSSSNYNDYAPTKTGTGASGTWGIAISGNAATATKLATRRAINGTDFDGTAAITTTQWGATRSITVGITPKNVNGAANVSWSLAEIGALPLTGGTMSGRITLSSIGTSWIDKGPGDNATYTTYNLEIKSHWGIGFKTYNDTVNAVLDTRAGKWETKGGYYKNNVSVSYEGHTHTFASLTSKPTTLSGYGITDASASNHTHSYLPLSGGTMTGKITIPSSASGTYGGAMEIRERGNVTTNQSAWDYAPCFTFHWGGRYAKRFGMRSDGKFAVDDTPFSLEGHTHTFSSLTGHIVAGNEFNFVPAGFSNNVHFNYKANGQSACTVSGYTFCNGNTGYANIKANGFIKNGSSSAYVLLGDGGHKAISDFATSSHSHSSIIHTNEQTASITLVDHSNYTWFRNSAGCWVFQTGTSGDDWTQSFSLHSPNVASAGANATWFEIGQRQSNTTDGKYRGVRIRKYAGSACVDGDLYVGNIYATASAQITKLSIDSDGKCYVNNTANRRAGMYGVYDSTKVGHIWSMGTAYMIPNDGANFGNLYGLAYKHTNNTTGGSMAGGHQMVWCEAGTPKAALGSLGVWVLGGFIKNGSSDSYILLGGGGHKAVSDFWLKTALNTTSIDFSCRNLTVAGSISQTSSIKYKTDVTKFEKRALELIKEVNVVNYRYKTSLEQTHIGFIAENTPKELSTQDQNIMDIGSCIGVLIKAVQELENEIKNLKNGK